MRRAVVPALATLAAAALVALLAFGLSRQGAGAKLVGSRPPQSALPRLDGRGRTSLAAFRGRMVLVNVFASWCPPCKDEAPLLRSAQRRLAAHGATVVGVTYNDTEPDARSFVRRYRLPFPVLRDVDEHFSQALGVHGVPESFLIDRAGRVTLVRRAPVDRAFLAEVERRAAQ